MICTEYVAAIRKMGPAGRDAFGELLAGPGDWYLAHCALFELDPAEIDAGRFVPQLKALVASDEPRLKWAAAEAVGRAKSPPLELVAAVADLFGDQPLLRRFPEQTGMDAPGGGIVVRALVAIGTPALTGYDTRHLLSC